MGRKFGFFGPDKKKNEAHAQHMAAMENQMVVAQTAYSRQIDNMMEQATAYQKELNSHFTETQKRTDETKRRVLGARVRGDVFDDVYSHKTDLPFKLGGN